MNCVCPCYGHQQESVFVMTRTHCPKVDTLVLITPKISLQSVAISLAIVRGPCLIGQTCPTECKLSMVWVSVNMARVALTWFFALYMVGCCWALSKRNIKSEKEVILRELVSTNCNTNQKYLSLISNICIALERLLLRISEKLVD